MDDLRRAEWEQWQLVCAQLKGCGAVSSADLTAPQNENRTKGCQLLNEIRFWGDLRAKQGKAEPSV